MSIDLINKKKLMAEVEALNSYFVTRKLNHIEGEIVMNQLIGQIQAQATILFSKSIKSI